jgi:hypothetical protein
MPAITIKTANADGICFSFNQSIGGVPSSARKKEISKSTTTDCARLIPAIIITSAATLTRILIPREELFCSAIDLCDYFFYLKTESIENLKSVLNYDCSLLNNFTLKKMFRVHDVL